MSCGGIENFKLDIYIIDSGLTLESDLPYFKIRALTLSLEQYYIFTLNPSLNVVKVAGSQPLVKHSEEHINSIVSANSKPVYVYKDNILV